MENSVSIRKKKGDEQMAVIVQKKHQTRVVEEEIVRFNIHQRIQHTLMLSSFILLAATGIPQKFSDASISQWWIAFWGGVENARSIHHFFAWVMIVDCVYHIAYNTVYKVGIRREPLPVSIIPSPKDVMDFIHEMKYFVGLSKDRPMFDRYSYHEKFDYWAIFWGIPVMAGSGLVLMYPVLVSKLLPGGVIPVVQVAHSDEAILAVLWIAIVHFFYVHLAPHIFPFNKSMFTGSVPKERYALDHPLEYERIFKSKEPVQEEPA